MVNKPVIYKLTGYRFSAGFTLLELMIAVSIFALVSLLAMGGMSHIMSLQQQSQQSYRQLNQLQLFFEVLDRELSHLVDRPVRGEYGLTLSAFSSITSDGLDGMEFTHQGRAMPGENFTLQRVAYFVQGEKLYKKIWPVLDRSEDTRSYQSVVLDNIEQFNIRYLVRLAPDRVEWQESISDIRQLQGIEVTVYQYNNEVYRVFPVRI